LNDSLTSAAHNTIPRRRPVPLLLVVGGSLLASLHVLHFLDVLNVTPGGPLGGLTLLVRANITPLAWLAYVTLLCGVLAQLDRSSWLQRYRNRFAVLWLFSVPAWCYFDAQNFFFLRDPVTGLRAWEYINLPPSFDDRLLGYLVAFGAIAPGMFLTAEVLNRCGFVRLRTAPLRWSLQSKRAAVASVVILGLALTPVPFLVGTAASNLAIWVGTWALLDPLNLLLGRPSILRDWSQGRWGRTLALGAGGLVCGFLWEFWNFWAGTKWVYHLPFLGSWEHVKYFEMPVPGLLGFIAFGIQTWTMWQTALLLLSPFVEGEQNSKPDMILQSYTCF
jgi:hypothetical protein